LNVLFLSGYIQSKNHIHNDHNHDNYRSSHRAHSYQTCTDNDDRGLGDSESCGCNRIEDEYNSMACMHDHSNPCDDRRNNRHYGVRSGLSCDNCGNRESENDDLAFCIYLFEGN